MAITQLCFVYISKTLTSTTLRELHKIPLSCTHGYHSSDESASLFSQSLRSLKTG